MRASRLIKHCSIAITGIFTLTVSVTGTAQQTQNMHYMGGFNDFLLLVYEDTECPACATSFDAVHQVTEKLALPMERIIFPVTTGRLESEVEGMVSHCVRKYVGPRHQSAVVRALHKMNLTDGPMLVNELAEQAPELLGGSKAASNRGAAEAVLACIDDPNEHKFIEDSIAMGLRYQVSGTPTFQLLNWKTLGNGAVTGVPNTQEALIEWIKTTALLTEDVDPTDEIEIEQFLATNTVLKRPYLEYLERIKPHVVGEDINTPDEVRGVITELFGK